METERQMAPEEAAARLIAHKLLTAYERFRGEGAWRDKLRADIRSIFLNANITGMPMQDETVVVRRFLTVVDEVFGIEPQQKD